MSAAGAGMKRVTTPIRNHWTTQDGVRMAYCCVGTGVVSVAVPADHEDGRQIIIEQDVNGRWALCREVRA